MRRWPLYLLITLIIWVVLSDLAYYWWKNLNPSHVWSLHNLDHDEPMPLQTWHDYPTNGGQKDAHRRFYS